MRDAIERIFYPAKTRATGGRNGTARSSEGDLKIRLSSPNASNDGTKPEQLFAAGWSASLLEAIGAAASKLSIAFPEGTAIDAEVDLGVGADAYGRCATNAILHSGYRQCAQ